MEAQAQPLYPLGEEGFVLMVQEKDQVMVVALTLKIVDLTLKIVALALKIVASQEWQVDWLLVLPHLHLMMCR